MFGNKTIEVLFKARQNHLTNACLKEGRLPPISVENSVFPGKTIVETRHRILFCPVQKAGSTFWKKTLKAMNSQGKFTSPYQVGRQNKRYTELYQDFRKSRPKYMRNLFMKYAVSLLVVRDPYTKLFSAYVDKLYHPNYLFWKVTGQPVQQMTNNSHRSSCGNNISFSEFIKYIIFQSNRIGGSLNTHFTPVYKHCDPCRAKYDYIMKFENFKDDFYFIIDSWNTKFNLNISFDDFEGETALNVAETHIDISFSTKRLYAHQCNISAYNFLLRTWRFLQISGYIPKEVELPFPNDMHTSKITKEEVLGAVKDVLSNDINWTRVKTQRHEALVQAYQTIDKNDIMRLREIVKPDCEYFGYDNFPEYLFEKSVETFNYFDGLSYS